MLSPEAVMKSFFLIQDVLKSDRGIGVYIFYGLVTENDDTNETTEQESSFQASAQTELEKLRAPLSHNSNQGVHLYLAWQAFLVKSRTDDGHNYHFSIVDMFFTNLNIIAKNEFIKDILFKTSRKKNAIN